MDEREQGAAKRLLVSLQPDAALSAIGGIHLATWLNCSPAGAMVVAGSVLFALAWVFSPSQGLLRRWLGRELDELDEEELERLAKGT